MKLKNKKEELIERAIKVLSNRKALNYKQIAAELNISDKAERQLLNSLLDELSKKGLIEKDGVGKYRGQTEDVQEQIAMDHVDPVFDHDHDASAIAIGFH